MTSESIFIFCLAVMLATAKPGPGMIAILSRTMASGFKAGFSLALGVHTVMQIFFVLSVVGLTFIQQELWFFASTMKSVGAAYMIYLGVKGLMRVDNGGWGGNTATQSKMAMLENYMAGFLTTLANPLSILLFAALVPSLINMNDFTTSDILMGCLLVLMCNGFILFLECVLASQIRDALNDTKVVRRINAVTSVIFILIGLVLAVSLFPLINFQPIG